jgi:hypothetical protein
LTPIGDGDAMDAAIPRVAAYRFHMTKSVAACVGHPFVVKSAVAVSMLSVHAAAFAQNTLRPPTPGKPETPGLVMQILFAALGIGLVAGVFLIKAKRGHQD